MRFDIIEYFAKTIQNTPTERTHSLREDCECAFRVFFHCMIQFFKTFRMITKFKIWGQKMCIFISFHIVNQYQTKSAVFSPKITMITNVILIFLQQFNKQEVN